MGCLTQQGVEIKAQSERKNKIIEPKNEEIKNSTSKNNHDNDNKENKSQDKKSEKEIEIKNVQNNKNDMIKNDPFNPLDDKHENNKSKGNKSGDGNKNPFDEVEENKSDINIKNPLDEVEEDKSDDGKINPFDEVEEIESDKELNENEKSKYQMQLNIKFNENTKISSVTKLSDEKIALLLRDDKEIMIYSLKTGKLCYNFKEEKVIYRIKELKDKRIAVLFDLENKNELKIYSLENENLIIKINHEYIGHFVELKNNDLMFHSTKEIFFYKLKKDHNYELYQTIDESNQEINKTKKREFLFFEFNDNKDEYKYNINNVYEISNGNLVSCNTYGIKIYKKDLNGQYQLTFSHQMGEEPNKLIEINNNILIIYGNIVNSLSPTFFSEYISLNKYDIENQKMTLLSSDDYTDRHLKGIIFGFKYLYHKNFLFIGFCRKLIVLDLNKNGELIGEYSVDDDKNSVTNINEFLFNIGDDNFLIKDHNDKYKLLRYKNNKFEFIKYFRYEILLKIDDDNFLIKAHNDEYKLFRY